MKGQGNYAGNECSKMALNFKHGQVQEKERKIRLYIIHDDLKLTCQRNEQLLINSIIHLMSTFIISLSLYRTKYMRA